MRKTRSLVIVFSVLFVLSMLLSACQPAAAPTEAPKAVEPTKAPEAAKPTEAPKPVEPAKPAVTYKMAVIFPGVITDADYNTLGYLGMAAVQKDLGIDTAYSESVPVPDVDRVMREYLDQKFNIIFVHGGQFLKQTLELAKQFPDVTFIGEGDGKVENSPANFWMIDRQFHTGYYVLGYIAAKSTKTGKIGYLCGLTQPFSYAEIHAVKQALADNNLKAEVKPVWVGDFNDPSKARQVADQMIADNADVIMGSLNLGMFGLFEAVKAVPDKNILVTAKYTDKTSFAPKNYVTAVLYDWKTPLTDIVKKVQAGEKGGYYPMEFGKGVNIQLPLKNVDPALGAEVQKVIDDIKSGKIVVKKDVTEIK